MSAERPTGASQRNAISNAMARTMREFYGRGPARTRTFICDRFVFSMLDDVLTPAEQTLKRGGRGELVRRARLTFEDIMTSAFTGQIEAITDAKVLAYHSQVAFEPDMALEIFVLDRPPHGTLTPALASEVRSARLEEPGSVGDADDIAGPSDDEPVLATATEPPAPARRAEGQQRTAIANAVARIVHEHWGKGPTHARTYIHDDFVFCVLEDVLTTVERTLVAGQETDLVRELRLEVQAIARRELAEQVEALTGRRVRACHSQIVFDPDILFEIFVLGDG